MKTILVVDDDRNLRRLYKSELEAEGYRILLAENGTQAIDLANDESPDLIVMDIRMPETDGLEAMARSAYSCYKDNFLTWAADGYIIKSADLVPLKEKIHEVLCSRTAA
jgi:DNA-binding NtrC family response regulator